MHKLQHSINLLGQAKELFFAPARKPLPGDGAGQPAPQPQPQYSVVKDWATNISFAVVIAVIIYILLPDMALAASDWASQVNTKISETTSLMVKVAGGVLAISLIVYAIYGITQGRFEVQRFLQFLIAGILIGGATLISDWLLN